MGKGMYLEDGAMWKEAKTIMDKAKQKPTKEGWTFNKSAKEIEMKKEMDAANERSGRAIIAKELQNINRSPLQEFEIALQALTKDMGTASDWGFKEVPSIPLIAETLKTVIDALSMIKKLEIMREPENKAEYDCKIELITLTEQLIGMKQFLIIEEEDGS